MPTPAAVADVNASPRHVVGRDVTHSDAMRHIDLDWGSLLFDPPGTIDEAIFYQAFFGIIVGLGAGREIDLIDGMPLIIVKQRTAHRIRVAHECDAVGAGLSQMA